jgi:hypothetical protein
VRSSRYQSEDLLAALSWIREARDGHRGISARYIAWLWATLGPDHFLPLDGINAVCEHYGISPRTMRWNLGALRAGFGIGQDARRALLAVPEYAERHDRERDADESEGRSCR